MTKLIRHSSTKDGTQYNYVLLDSVTALHAFVDREMTSLNTHNRNVWEQTRRDILSLIKSGSDKFGVPSPANLAALESHRFFQAMPLVKEIRPLIKKHLSRYMNHLETDVMPKPKVSYNDRGLGIFSFDRAAMGLYTLSKIKTKTPLETTATQINIELGRANVRSMERNVYAYFENKNVSRPSARLYLMAGGNIGVSGKDMLYVGLAAGELVEFLEERGVAVEINIMIGSAYRDMINMAVVCVKRFQDKADINQLLLLSSDPKYFRCNGFRTIIALANQFDVHVDTGLGRITDSIGKDFVRATRGLGFVFEQSYSVEAATSEVIKIIESINQRVTA